MRTVQEMVKNDPFIHREIMDILESGRNLPVAEKLGVSRNAVMKSMVGPVAELPLAEAMIRLHLRPSLLVKNNKITLPDSLELKKRIVPYLPKIENRIGSVGRLDLRNMGRNFAGTGWMVTEDIIVTNRHVAELFSEQKNKNLVFRKNALGDNIEVFIDYKEEYMGPQVLNSQFEVKVEKVIYMTESDKSKPDIAFLKLKYDSNLPPPIAISGSKLIKNQEISVLGYPAYDPGGFLSQSAALNVFGNIYDVKRCSPGEVIEFTENSWYFFHDCTTLGGNSGSCVIDNNTGYAVGLHFLGDTGKENYAVKGEEILKHLTKVSTKVSVTENTLNPKNGEGDLAKETQQEKPLDYYADKTGFDELFLGDENRITLPTVKENKSNLLSYNFNGTERSVLNYTHFSVAMNKARRLCYYSACNIDGLQSIRGVKRSGWKTDPRIPNEYQIIEECYGRPPQFSRGHMTRKEDPIWGSLPLAKMAGDDTFHVTNATPQMQPFNAPVWLELENYALENAREDHMKISVITGPVFNDDDPERYGVKIPLEFYKIIAFIYEGTGKMSATGYLVSQKEYLSNLEFVFGTFNTYQTSIKSIEAKTGLEFGILSTLDPFSGLEFPRTILSSAADVKFI